MRMIAVYHKGEVLKYISHLDIQRTLQRAFRRAGLPLAYSQGFNPHPQVSFASALSTGVSSDAEWFEVQLSEDMSPRAFMDALNATMPEGMRISDAFVSPENFGTLAAKTCAAEYVAQVRFDAPISDEALQTALSALLDGEIIVNKRTKSGIKPVDIRPQVLKVSATGIGADTVILRVLGKLQADGGLRMELLLRALFDRLDAHGQTNICRIAMYFTGDGPLPRLP